MDIRKMINEEITKVMKPRNFVSDIKGSTTNNAPLVPLSESNAQRLINKHGMKGYIILSASRHERTPQENERLTADLRDDIKDSGFSYTPVYGGFKEEGMDTTSYEKSFMVYSQNRKGEDMGMEALVDFGREMCSKYTQESILVKQPDKNPQYIKADGTLDSDLGSGTSFNDYKQVYFTDLKKSNGAINSNITDRSKHGTPKATKPRRFSFTEAYINPAPMTYNEGHVRYLQGEVFLHD